jgi:uncharacterized protein (TIGR04255 family)
MTYQTFDKAPLLEIIGEFRWPTQIMLTVGAAPQQQTAMVSSPDQEQFFDSLASELFQRGFEKSERLIPFGITALPNQAVVRYRSEKEKSLMYQAGPGVFSVHGIPPYRSWREFRPFVANGAEAVSRARAATKDASPFSQLTLRYIDLFGEDLAEGRDVEHFISDVAGISIRLPAELLKMRSKDEIRSLFVKFVLPLGCGALSVGIGDGTANNRPGLILDTAVASNNVLENSLDAIMGFFDAAHDATNRTFLELTKPIHNLMRPSGEKAR